MFIAQIDFEISESVDNERQTDAIYSFLAALLHKGRILDRGFAVFQTHNVFRTFVRVPAKDAFENFSD